MHRASRGARTTGQRDAYDFGAHVNALEPVFAPAPGGEIDQGWLITQTLDTHRGTSGYDILNAQRIGEGPVATIELGEVLPISFHGQWPIVREAKKMSS
jgi:carotenoid cleavage dioxygenase